MSPTGRERDPFECFGIEYASFGEKVPRSRVKRTVIVTADGKGGRSNGGKPIAAIPTMSDVIRGLVNAGATSVADVKTQWERLRRKKRIDAAWGRDCEQIARKFLRCR